MTTTNSTPATPLVELDNLTIRRDNTTILQNCSWKIMPGENWVIFGPNGSGKTSILNALQGYLWPTTGHIRVFGGTLGDGVNIPAMRRQVPVVSESVRRLIHDHLTGLEIIVTGLRGHLNIFSPITQEEYLAARDSAAATGLTGLLDKPFAVMSTGERQRVLMTRALMQRPRILILDEPCSGLDLAGREWVMQLTSQIASLPDSPTLLLTTHHPEEISQVFTHVLLIKQGRIFDSGKISDIFTSKNLSALFDIPLEVHNTDGRWTAQAR